MSRQYSSREIIRGGEIIGGGCNHPGDNFTQGKLSGEQSFREQLSRGNFPRGQFSLGIIIIGGNCPSGSHPGGSFSRLQFSGYRLQGSFEF